VTTLILFLLLVQVVQAQSISTLNPLSHWTCDEANGVRYDSVASTTNDLTSINGVASASGLLGNACDIEKSSSQRLTITDANQVGLDRTGSWSASFWYNPESLPTSGNADYWFGKWGGSGSKSYGAGYANTSGTYYLDGTISNNGSTQSHTNVAFSISTSQWKHYLLRYSNTGHFSIFINGVHISTTAGFLTSVYNSSSDFDIGAMKVNASTYFYSDGLFDEFTFFGYAVSTATVSTLYNGGTPLSFDEIPTASTSFKIIPYNTNMPQLESIHCPDATCTLQYASTTTTFMSPDLMFLLFFVFVSVAIIATVVTRKIL